MSRLLGWFVDHRVAANLVMLLLTVGGLLMMPRLQQEVFPEVQLPVVVVEVPYPGATPEEVEQGIVLAVEDAVRGLDGVKEVRSVAAEGLAVVSAELRLSANEDQLASDVESAVDRITSLPEDAETPVIQLASNRRQVVSLILYGDAPEASLRELAEQTRADLLADPRVTYVELSAVRPPEISVEVDRAELRRLGLTPVEVAGAVDRGSVRIPGGELEGEGGETLIRTDAQADTGDEVGDIVLAQGSDGALVRLREVAEVEDGFRDTDTAATFDGMPAARVDVFRVGDETPLDVSEAVREEAEALRARLPEGVRVKVWGDQSEIFEDRVNLLVENGLLGLALVLLLLGPFLQPRLAFWVTLGIPISFLGAFLFMPAVGVSINIISLFAFIVTLGLVVDDAIVVGEAIHHRREQGMGRREAALRGAKDVARPVIFAVLTTCVAFAPMFYVPGTTGKLFVNIPAVVLLVLACSLVECLLILPAHLSHPMPRPLDWLLTPFLWLFDKLGSDRFDRGLKWFTERIYRPVAERAVRWRYLTVAVGVALLLGVGGLFVGERIDFTFLPQVQDEEVSVTLQLPVGTAMEVTRARVDAATVAAREAAEGSDDGEDLIAGIFAQVGSSGAQEQSAVQAAASSGGHLGSVTVDLGPAGPRTTSSKAFVEAWREALGEVPGAETVTFRYTAAASGGPDIDLRVSHPDRDTLRAAAGEVAAALRGYTGVRDVDDGYTPGKEQLDLSLSPRGRALGLTERSLALQVRGAFFGAEAARQQRGRDELRIYARLPEDQREAAEDVQELMMATPRGGEVPLPEAARIERTHAPTSIRRRNGERVLHVTAYVHGDANANDVVAAARQGRIAELEERYPRLTVAPAGRQEQQRESLGALRTGFAVALLVIFGLLAVTFRSYAQPLVVMSAIPFGAVGAVAGHLLLGYDLSISSMFGLIALAGVMVNDSLLLVVTANEHREEGASALDAALRAGQRRLRPILLTSMTTFLGLAPMIFETSVQARFLIPMALSLGFGILFATFIIVLLVPAVYVAVDDAVRLSRRLLDRLFGARREAEGEERGAGEPAEGTT